MKKNIISSISIVIACSLFLPLVSFRKILEARETDQTLCRHLTAQHLNFEIGYYDAIGRKIRYLLIDNGAKNNLIIVHGAPGSLSRFEDFFTDSLLRKNYNFYLLDRPGYGYSGFGNAEVSIDSNVKALLPLFRLIKDTCAKNVLLGHSYGGPIAARMAMLYPKQVDALILLCPAIQPGQEKTYPISYAMVNEQYNWIFPTILVTASQEKLTHREELEKIERGWASVQCPVTMIQGLADYLIYPSNIDFIKDRVDDSLLNVIALQKETHFLTKKAYSPIIQAIRAAAQP